ncbi:MAG: lipid II:glycine glycyltransferase FemX [Verrucomicrobiales bacterium]
MTRRSDEISDDEWDRFVHSCPGGNIEQTSSWAQLKGHYGWESHRVVYRRNGEIEGGAQLLLRRANYIGPIAYLARGPLVRADDPVAMRGTVDEIELAARKLNVVYLVIAPPFEGASPEEELRARGFVLKPHALPPSKVPVATPITDLSPSLDELLQGASRVVRRSIKKAAASPLSFRRGAEHEVDTFRSLMYQLCQRRGDTPAPPQRDFFDKAWQHLGESGLARVYLAELDGEPVSAVFVFTFNHSFQLWKAGWSGAHKKHCPNHFLYWEMIKTAKREGFDKFDQIQILPQHASLLKRGERPEGPYSGVTNFKMSWGAEIHSSPPVMAKSYRTMSQAFVRAGGLDLIAKTGNWRILSRLKW